MILIKSPVALVCTFLWIGFVGAISFMEAWLKFRAPGITVPVALGIGRLVFTALNRVEWVLAMAILGDLLYSKTRLFSPQNAMYIIPLVVLIIQSVWVLPALDARLELRLQGHILPPSALHVSYLIMETVKTFCLLIYGISFLKHTTI